jgi:hypothetical protein
MSKHRFFTPQNFDRNMAVMGILVALGLIGYLSLNYTSRFVYILTGILALISCVLWLILRPKASLQKVYFKSETAFTSLGVIYFALLGGIISVYYLRTDVYVRPLLFFVLVAATAGVVAIEVLFCNLNRNQHYFVLTQTIILCLAIVWSELFLYPGLVGIDPWAHQRFTSFIIQTGVIPTGLSYSRLPVMHLEIGSTMLLTGLPYKYATMLSVGLIEVICGILFVFLLGRFLFNIKVGLLASLLLGIGNSFIGMAFWTTPTSIAAIFVLVVLFLCFKFIMFSTGTRVFLTVFFMIVLIFAHTVTSMALTLILIVGFLIGSLFNSTYYKSRLIPLTLNLAGFFAVGMFAWWTYVSGHILKFADFIYWGFTMDLFLRSPKEVSTYIAAAPQGELLFNQIGMFLFFMLSFIGCFYMISRRYGNMLTFNYVLAGLTPLAIGFFSYISGFYLLPERWWYYSMILLAIPLAVALILLANTLKTTRKKAAFLFIFITSLAFLLIMSSTANMDNNTFAKNTGVRMSLTQSEIDAAAYFANATTNTTTIGSDYDYFSNPSSSIMVNYFHMNFSHVKSIDYHILHKNYTNATTIVVIRQTIITNVFRAYGSPYRITYNPRTLLEQQGYSRIYDSTTVTGYYNTGD